MALSLTTLKELVGQTGGLSDKALQHLIDSENAWISQVMPSVEDCPTRDSVLVDLIKNRIAYEGYSSISTKGFSMSYQEHRDTIVSRLWTLELIS